MAYQLDKIEYYPRDDAGNGTVTQMEIATSIDGIHWSEGQVYTFARDNTTKTVEMDGVTARYVRFIPRASVGNFFSASEILVYKVDGTNGSIVGDVNHSGALDENDLTFLGLIAMMDPPREESKAAVAECISAGIKPIMITGDHKVTALAIAKELDIYREGNTVISGEELDTMTDDELDDAVKTTTVFARVSPADKLRIIQSMKRTGEVAAKELAVGEAAARNLKLDEARFYNMEPAEFDGFERSAVGIAENAQGHIIERDGYARCGQLAR